MYKDTEGDADLNHLLSIAYWHMLDKSYTQTDVRFVSWGRPEAVPHGDKKAHMRNATQTMHSRHGPLGGHVHIYSNVIQGSPRRFYTVLGSHQLMCEPLRHQS